MTKTTMDLSELLAKHDQGDFLCGIAEAVLQLIMETDVEGLSGAGRHKRNGERTAWRNGYRERALDTRLDTLNLRVPKLRPGSYFPGFLDSRKTSEQALVAVIQEAWIGGVSTRRVDELVQVMGLGGVRLMISDAHTGLKAAIARVFEATWQRCRVHWIRNALAHVFRGQHTVVAAAIRLAFDQPDRAHAGETWRKVSEQLRPRWPKLADLMDAREHDVLAYMSFPRQHRTKLHSTNRIERLNKEVNRRADVVGIFPNDASIMRLIGAVLFEANDEWQTSSRYMIVEAFAQIDTEDIGPILSITTKAA